jgi:hypothetical protein
MIKCKLALLHAMKECRGNRGVALLILNRGARLSWWSNSRLGLPPPAQKEPQFTFEQEAGWVLQPAWTVVGSEDLVPLP